MRIFDIPNTLNRDDVLPIYANHRSKAGIYGGMVDLLRCWVDMGNYLSDIKETSVSRVPNDRELSKR